MATTSNDLTKAIQKPSSRSKSTRNQYGKSRSGCRQCKKRHVKCDESFPQCTNCTRRGLKCPGYESQLRWSKKHERLLVENGSSLAPHAQHVDGNSHSRDTNLGTLQETYPNATGPKNTARPSHNIPNVTSGPETGRMADEFNIDQIRTDSRNQGSDQYAWIETGLIPGPETVYSSDAVHVGYAPESRIDPGELPHGYASESQLLLDTLPHSQSDETYLMEHNRGKTAQTSEFSLTPSGLSAGWEPDAAANTTSSEFPTAATDARMDHHAQSTCLPQALTHLPIQLIQYWFTHICPIWSTFDSQCNYNRQIASNTWSTSEAVFHTLQHMSAAYMMQTVPGLGQMLPTLTLQAMESIKREATRLKNSPMPDVKADIVFAVLGLGTSLHWTHCTVDTNWLNEIRTLLSLWKQNLSPVQGGVHAYFRQAMVYWQMLMCLIVDDVSHEGLDLRRRKHAGGMTTLTPMSDNIHTAGPASRLDILQEFEGTRPNSWCGVSCEVIDIFGQVLALCRKARIRQRTGKFTLRTSSEAIRDIKVAQELQSELIALDFQSVIFMDELLGFPSNTEDVSTPITHLLRTADAYRNASLLQLYLTFEDLDVTFADEPQADGGYLSGVLNGHLAGASRTQKLSALALQIVSILEEIPTDSGSRSIHPILYLAVAPGLRFGAIDQGVVETVCDRDAVSATAVAADDPSQRDPTTRLSNDNEAQRTVNHSHNKQLPQTWSPWPSSKIAIARGFIETRIKALRSVLPQRPLAMILDLTQAIWNGNDLADIGGENNVHWMDIMMDSSLQTLFR